MKLLNWETGMFGFETRDTSSNNLGKSDTSRKVAFFKLLTSWLSLFIVEVILVSSMNIGRDLVGFDVVIFKVAGDTSVFT